MNLQAFHNSEATKLEYVTRLQEHYDQDEIIKGTYWEDGKGCAVGCTVHSGSHDCYELELGIPTWMARLEDTLFEGMPNTDAKKFPIKFLQSIPIGFSNWQHIYHQFCVFILSDICKNTDNPIVKQSICDIVTLHKEESDDKSAWSAARSAAWSAARSAAWHAAESAAKSARSAAKSARSAARSAAWSAESTAMSAESAAMSAMSAESTAMSAAWHAAESAAYFQISEKLIELLKDESK